VATALGGLLKQSVNAGIQFEQTKVAFTTMLGGGEAGAKRATVMLKELADFAKRTPFELVGLQNQTSQLMAMGFSAEEVLPMLKDL